MQICYRGKINEMGLVAFRCILPLSLSFSLSLQGTKEHNESREQTPNARLVWDNGVLLKRTNLFKRSNF